MEYVRSVEVERERGIELPEKRDITSPILSFIKHGRKRHKRGV